nr:L,D-transpeptidase family protein [Sphingomonas guangdongensis]
MRRVAMVAAVLAGGAGSDSPVMAQSLETAAASLRTGQYRWSDPDPSVGDVAVVINLQQQRAYAFRAQRLIGVASVSTGKPGKRTPTGDFTVLQKRVWHRSNLYSNAPMPYMQRLTWTGIALHAGHNPGYPASHGCIRLPREFAVLLFGVTKMGAPVTIVGAGDVDAPARRDPPVIIARLGELSLADGFAEVTWTPEAEAQPAASNGQWVGGDRFSVPAIALVPPEDWRARRESNPRPRR